MYVIIVRKIRIIRCKIILYSLIPMCINSLLIDRQVNVGNIAHLLTTTGHCCVTLKTQELLINLSVSQQCPVVSRYARLPTLTIVLINT